jgi:nitroreductase
VVGHRTSKKNKEEFLAQKIMRSFRPVRSGIITIAVVIVVVFLPKMNNAFRSHLMQQFMASARTQARSPPVAVCGWLGADNNNGDRDSSSCGANEELPSKHAPPSVKARLTNQHRQPFSAYPYTTPMLQSTDKRSLFYDPTVELSDIDSSEDQYHNSTTAKNTTTTATNANAATVGESSSSSSSSVRQHQPNATATALQSLLRTRRTSSNYQYPPIHSVDFYKAALDRAVAAGRTAPNHKRTEAVSFRRIAAPDTIQKLADIATKVSNNPTKGEKWQRTPAFLVTLVHHETVQAKTHVPITADNTTTAATSEDDLYKPISFVPPTSTLELEDYAAACAATQNVLLSLHSEGLATKWATGPVIQTPAFRTLIDANATDRIVALIFIGESASQTTMKRTYRRDFHGDFLRDV